MNIIALILFAIPFLGAAAAVEVGASPWAAAGCGYFALVFLLRCFASDGGLSEN